MNIDKATRMLEEAWPDCRSSCYVEKNNSNNKQYDLSIIIPCYNVESYIRTCLDSVYTQKTKYSFCVIAVNDGSTDNTLSILKEYTGKPGFVLIDQENKGIAFTRNVGLNNINSCYVTFLDSDDLLTPTSIELLLDTAHSTKADIVEGSAIRIDSDGNEFIDQKFIHSETGYPNNSNELFGVPWAKVYKAELFDNVRFPLYTYEDSVNKEIVFPLAQTRYIIRNVVYKYRVNTSGISFTSVRSFKSIDAVWINLSLYNDRNRFRALTKTDEYYSYKIQAALLINTRTQNLSRSLRKACFVVYGEFIRREFANYRLKDRKYRLLECALRNNSYMLYRLFFIYSKIRNKLHFSG